jgi:hypothetical protein
MRYAFKIVVGKPEGRTRHLVDLGVCDGIILKRIVKKWIGALRTGFDWLRIGISGEFLWPR